VTPPPFISDIKQFNSNKIPTDTINMEQELIKRKIYSTPKARMSIQRKKVFCSPKYLENMAAFRFGITNLNQWGN